MKQLQKLISAVVVVALFLSMSPTSSFVEAASCRPGMKIKSVSPYLDTNGFIQGTVSCVADYSRFCVVVYIGIFADPLGGTGAGWWNKPFFDKPCTPIRAGGAWKTDIVTGGVDYAANYIAAFLVPKKATVPLLAGQAELLISTNICATARTGKLVTRPLNSSERFMTSPLCPGAAPILS